MGILGLSFRELAQEEYVSMASLTAGVSNPPLRLIVRLASSPSGGVSRTVSAAMSRRSAPTAPGAIQLLRRHFFPTYEENRRALGSAGGNRFGHRRGIRVDNELARFLRMTERQSLDAQQSGDFCQETCAILRYFRRKRWILVECQSRVRNRGGRGRRLLQTWIDCVVYDADHGIHRAIEIKTGYANYFTQSLSRMSEPLSNVGDCPLHQAILQLITGMILSTQSTRGRVFRADAGYVLHVVGDEVRPYSLSAVPWLNTAREAIAALL